MVDTVTTVPSTWVIVPAIEQHNQHGCNTLCPPRKIRFSRTKRQQRPLTGLVYHSLVVVADVDPAGAGDGFGPDIDGEI